MIPEYRPLEQWPELIVAFTSDLSRCAHHAQARALLAGLSHAEKTIIYAACPTQLQAQLWAMRGNAATLGVTEDPTHD